MLTYLVVAPVAVAVLMYFVSSVNLVRILAIAFQAAMFIASIVLVYHTRDAEVAVFIGNYDGGLGITLRANSLSGTFVLITTFIFLVISVYSYREKENMPLFWFLMFIMEAALIGLFLSNDLFNVFVLVEVSTAVTLVLAMYDRNKRNMFHGMVFLLTSIVSAQFYLFGLGYLYMLTGTLDFNTLAAAIAALPAGSLVLPYALIMTSIAFKCTLIPFFSWSPKVRVYPGALTVVQAMLSGLQIKSAVYLFIRFQEIFEPIAARDFFLIAGIISGLFGAFMAICQTNVKMILAYHTVSQVGLIIIGVSLGNFHSNIGGLYHIISHAVFKTALFLCAGIISDTYGTANVYNIRGVIRRMPVVGAAAAAAVLGIVGAPFFIGSVSKYFISYDIPLLLNIATIVISLGTIISFIKFASMLLGKAPKEPGYTVDRFKNASVLVLGAACLAGGVFGTQIVYFLFRQEVGIVLWGYIQKSLIFLSSVGVGFVVYKCAVNGNKVLKRIGEMTLGFKSICAAIGVFLGALLLYVGWVN